MSATEIENSGVPLPRISRVQALPGFRLSVIWAEGSRTGSTDTIDLAPVINTYTFYRPLRKNKELFQTAHLVDDGNAIAWGDGTIDMSAELIEDIANEAMTPKDFARFLERNKLTQNAAAALLGYSRRQIGYYLSTGPIPRVVALACYGYEARQKASDPTVRGEGGRTGLWSNLLTSNVKFPLGPLTTRDKKAPEGVLERLAWKTTKEVELKFWLSNLFARASQEADTVPPRKTVLRKRKLLVREHAQEPARADRNSIDSVDSLCLLDVARLLDHDAAADLWDRFISGERNVFTLKLYTAQGRKAFDEIFKKYRSDRDFMRKVDWYIGEFEHLLEEVSRDDRDQARTYLTSETGNVYTILAHAAGRFD
jgi:hypothetical protein